MLDYIGTSIALVAKFATRDNFRGSDLGTITMTVCDWLDGGGK